MNAVHFDFSKTFGSVNYKFILQKLIFMHLLQDKVMVNLNSIPLKAKNIFLLKLITLPR